MDRHIYPKYLEQTVLTNSVDHAASDQGLQCLPLTQRYKWLYM